MQALDKVLRVIAIGGAATIPVAATLYPVLYTVDGGQRAIIMDYWKQKVLNDVVGEGTHIRWPIIQKPIIFDVRTKYRSIPTATGTKDQQMVNITLRVLHRPVLDKLPTIYKELGIDYEERILPSIGNEVMKAVVAQFNATELITRRHEVSNRISTDMVTLARTKYNLELVDIAITDLTFGKEFTQAVEQKQVAQQSAERAKELVRKAEYEKQASVIRASGEAEAAQLVADALRQNGNGLIELRKIQASKEIATLMAKSQHITYLPQNTNFLLAGAK